MAKELPYFKFEPAEYLTKDISFCSLPAQGLFVNICCYYWQRGCELTKDQLLRRLNYENELNELISEGVIDLENDNLIIKFLDSQLSEVEIKSNVNSKNGSKGGRPRKNPIESEIKPNENPIESESKGIREDKIREEEIRKEKIKEDKESLLPVDLKNQPERAKIDFNKLIKFFNDNRGSLPEVKKLTESRKKRIESIEKQYGKELIQVVIEKARDSDFIQGRKTNWIGSFDWIFKPENFIKIAEDNYINKKQTTKTDGEIFREAFNSDAAKNFRFSK